MAGYIGSNSSTSSPGSERKFNFTATSGQTVFSPLAYTPRFLHVFQNGVRLVETTDYTATNKTSFTLTTPASTGDQIVAISYAPFSPANAYTKEEAVSINGNEVISGEKEFTNTPIIPVATLNTQALQRGQINTANSAEVKTALNASGDAPIYACRAWVSFNASRVVVASGNVSSIGIVQTGLHTINFITPAPHANYSVSSLCQDDGVTNTGVSLSSGVSFTTVNGFRINTWAGGVSSGGQRNPGMTTCAVFY